MANVNAEAKGDASERVWNDLLQGQLTDRDRREEQRDAVRRSIPNEPTDTGVARVRFSRVWDLGRRNGGGRNVTFPARQYSVNGERRSFALLRPVGDASTQDAVREAVLAAYADTEAAAAVA